MKGATVEPDFASLSFGFLILILVTATPAGELDQSDDATPVTKQGKFHITSAANHISD